MPNGFGGFQLQPTQQDLFKQQLAQSLIQQGLQPSNVPGTGIGSALSILAGGLAQRGIGKRQEERQQAFGQGLQDILGADDLQTALAGTQNQDIRNVLGPLLLQQKLKQPAAMQTLTPEQVASAGLPTGTIAQQDPTTKALKVISKPPQILDPKVMAAKKEVAGAGAARQEVNLAQRPEAKGREEFATGIAQGATQIRQDARAARQQNAQLKTIKTIPFDSGPGSNFKVIGARVLEGMGIAPDNVQNFLSSAEQFKFVTQQNLLNALAKQKGPQTEGDAQRALETLPQIANTDEANQFIADMTIAANDRLIKQSEFMDRYLADEKNSIFDVEIAWANSEEGRKSLFDNENMAKWRDRAKLPGTLQTKELTFDPSTGRFK
jgi:hypothetical protein